VRVVLWTEQARADLAAIHAFISQDSPHYASVVISRLIAATGRLVSFAESGRAVPEFENPLVREVVHPPYRIVYRLVGANELHVLTVHHSSKSFPTEL
jgi:plasmid stabilization system protein ParE